MPKKLAQFILLSTQFPRGPLDRRLNFQVTVKQCYLLSTCHDKAILLPREEFLTLSSKLPMASFLRSILLPCSQSDLRWLDSLPEGMTDILIPEESLVILPVFQLLQFSINLCCQVWNYQEVPPENPMGSRNSIPSPHCVAITYHLLVLRVNHSSKQANSFFLIQWCKEPKAARSHLPTSWNHSSCEALSAWGTKTYKPAELKDT